MIIAPATATIAVSDPVSISSVFSYASVVASVQVVESSQDRPTGEPPETTSLFFTYTALGPAIVGTEAPGESVYHGVYATSIPVASTTIGFPPADTPTGAQKDTQPVVSETVTTYLSTIWVTAAAVKSPSPTTAPKNASTVTQSLQKRQTCSMVYAQMNGVWASWCNNWDGSTIVSYLTYNTTVLMTTPAGASPIPESVYDPSHTLKSSSASIISFSSVTSGETSVTPTPSQPMPVSNPSAPASSAVTASIVLTTWILVTQPVVTFTETISEASATSVTATTTSSAVEASSSCSQTGDFVITFDDLPTYSTNDSDTNAAPPMSMFAPYDHFYWASGYGYGPPPNSNYSAVDGGRMAQYNPQDATPVPATAEGRNLPGSFGAGLRVWDDIYWFDATSAYIGCNNTIEDVDCVVTATGYRWNENIMPNGTTANGQEVAAGVQQFTIPRCTFAPCMLTQFFFDVNQFTGLSTINLIAEAGNLQLEFYLDSFELSWANNSCAADIARQSSRKRATH